MKFVHIYIYIYNKEAQIRTKNCLKVLDIIMVEQV